RGRSETSWTLRWRETATGGAPAVGGRKRTARRMPARACGARDGSHRGFGAGALATAARGLGGLLAALDRRLHVVPTALEFAEHALCGHLALEVLDRAFDSLVTDGDLEGLANHRLAGRDGGRNVGRRGRGRHRQRASLVPFGPLRTYGARKYAY